MAWDIIRNSESNSRKESIMGKCPISEENAIITVFYVGNTYCKTDLQKTYHKAGIKCSLLERANKSEVSLCIEQCELAPDIF